MNKLKLGTQSTMTDVARLAGVSLMTVYRVMSGKTLVSARTRQKVSQAIAGLHYVPNQEARNLAGYRPLQIGFLYSDASAAYLGELLVGLLSQSCMQNVQLLVQQCDTDADTKAHLRRLIDSGLHGVILPPPLCTDEDLVAHIAGDGIPAVAVVCGLPEPALSSVGIDDYAAAYHMTRHLVSLGHHRIGFVTGNPRQAASARRLAGYRSALRALGADTSHELAVQGLFTYRSGLSAAEKLLALADRPTAIFASNDNMAAAVVAVAQRMGLDVPRDLTVTGFDDAALATTIWPTLTTVRQPINEIAQEAVKMVVRRIRARRIEPLAAPEHVKLGWELIRRQSDAVPRIRPSSLERMETSPNY